MESTELTAETPAFCTYATSSGVNRPDSPTTWKAKMEQGNN
jgi:hypothetical protein